MRLSRGIVSAVRAPRIRPSLLAAAVLVHRKGLERNGRAPLYQYGYGAYGSSTDPEFDQTVVSLLDRGFVYAIAHIRGGQELGRAWYDDGRLLKKTNTFTEFIDVTDFLVREGYAAPDKVFASGLSAGGLLMGAVANLAGEKYRGIAAHVPYVDAVTTMPAALQGQHGGQPRRTLRPLREPAGDGGGVRVLPAPAGNGQVEPSRQLRRQAPLCDRPKSVGTGRRVRYNY